jgi:hypothetical protein
MRFASAIPFALSAGLLASPVSADSPMGRFQGFVLPKGSNDLGGDRMMVLDTATGDLWQWWDSPALNQSPAKSGITYMGHGSPPV